MGTYSFINGKRFLLNDNQYVIRKNIGTDIDVENLNYKKVEVWNKEILLKEWFEERLIFETCLTTKDKRDLWDFTLLSRKEQEKARRAYRVIEPVLKGEVLPNEIDQYLKSLDPKVSKATYYRYKKKWDTYQNISALVDKKPGPKKMTTSKNSLDIIEEVLRDKI